MDKDQAHVGMMPNPLDDIDLNCQTCHTDYQKRAERFATLLNVTPKSSGPITIALQPLSGGGSTLQSSASTLPGHSADKSLWLWVLVAVAGVLLIGLSITWLKLSHR